MIFAAAARSVVALQLFTADVIKSLTFIF